MTELLRRIGLRHRLSVGMKFALITVVVTAVIIGASVAILLNRLHAEATVQSEAAARGAAVRVVSAVQSVFDGALDIVNSTSDTLIALKARGVADPEVYDTILRRMIDAGTDRYGAWFVWTKGHSPVRRATEPSTGIDEQHPFVTYWHQNGMEMLHDTVPREIYDNDLFRIPAESGQSYLLEPHAINALNGDPTLVTSFSRAIDDGGKILGVIDLDLKLDATTDALTAIALPPGAGFTVVSDGGVIAMSTTKGAAGDTLQHAMPHLAGLLAVARHGDGTNLVDGASGKNLQSWNAIHFSGVKTSWYLLLDVPEESLLNAATEDKIFLILVPSVALLMILGLVLMAMDQIVSRPLKALSTIINGLGEGLFDFAVPGRNRIDEVGDIARAVERLQESGLEIARLQEASGESEYQRLLQRRAELDSISARFSHSVASLVSTLQGVASTIDTQSREVSMTTKAALSRLNDVSGASTFAKGSMVSVATATSALLTTIGSIGEQTRQGKSAAVKVEQRTASTDRSIHELRDTISHIDDVAKLIAGVAGQINLIALNATIEAARAGEAGRGFAVVAQEIKTLAAQTAKATAEIGVQIAAVRKASGTADSHVDEMKEALVEMGRISAGIAGALDVQTDATGEIRGLIESALSRADGVESDMRELVRSSGQIQGAADVMLHQSSSLGAQISGLSQEIDNFLRFLKAA